METLVTVIAVSVVGWFPNHQLRLDLDCGHSKHFSPDAPVEVGDMVHCRKEHTNG